MFAVNHLAGFGDRPRAVAGLSTLTFVDSAISSTSSITVPGTALAGDIAVLISWARQSGVPTDSTPSGWTKPPGATASFDGAGSNDCRISVFYKVLVSGDISASVSTIVGSSANASVMFVFRPDATISAVTPSTFNAQATENNPSSQNVAASGQPAPLLVIGGVGCNGTAAFSTASPAFDSTVVNASAILIGGYNIYNSSPADHSIDMNDLGTTNGLISGYIRVS